MNTRVTFAADGELYGWTDISVPWTQQVLLVSLKYFIDIGGEFRSVHFFSTGHREN